MGISSSQFFNNLLKIADEKLIDQEKILEMLKFSIEKAYLKENPETKLLIEINSKKREISLFEVKTVVNKTEEEIDDDIEINLEDAKKINAKAKENEELNIEINLKLFEKRMASHVLQLFQQRLNEVNNLKIFETWENKINSIIRAEIEKVDNKYVEVNLGETMGFLPRNEQIPNEILEPGKSYLFLIKEIKQQSRSWPIILSRNDKKLLEYLLTSNITEIQDGIIEIKMIARIPGFKSKVVLSSNDPNIDPIGTCVGVGGKRIKDISAQINSEKIDIINYSDDPKQMLVNAMNPEKIIGVEISTDEETDNKIITIVCDDKDMAKIIGKNGINVKLLCQLTGWSIDFVPLTIAIEDKINFQDISNITPTKFNGSFNSRSNFGYKKFNSNYGSNSNNNSNKKNNYFYENNNNSNENNNIDSTRNNWDFLSRKAEEITDEDIENLLNGSVGIANKKKKKFNDNGSTKDNNNNSKFNNKLNKNKKSKNNILDEFSDISENDLLNDIDVNSDSFDEEIIEYNENYDEK